MLKETRYKVIEPDNTRTKEQRVLDGMAAWTAFWRANPHRFVKDYLGLNLHRFQQVNLTMIDDNIYSVYIASRG